MTSCEEAAGGVVGSEAPPTSGVSGAGGIIIDDDCLKERKWWCFLLSSFCTFIAGLLIVLLWRAFAFLCCRKEPEFAPNDPKGKEQKAARQSKEFEGTFMTEAKDWAGELISGQTTTGRILVSFSLFFLSFLLFLSPRVMLRNSSSVNKLAKNNVTSAAPRSFQILVIPASERPTFGI